MSRRLDGVTQWLCCTFLPSRWILLLLHRSIWKLSCCHSDSRVRRKKKPNLCLLLFQVSAAFLMAGADNVAASHSLPPTQFETVCEAASSALRIDRRYKNSSQIIATVQQHFAWVRTLLSFCWIGCDILGLDKAALSMWPFCFGVCLGVFLFCFFESLLPCPFCKKGSQYTWSCLEWIVFKIMVMIVNNLTCNQESWHLCLWHRVPGFPGAGLNSVGCLSSTL